MIGELIRLCHPFADMYVFQVVNQHVMSSDDPNDTSFLLVSILILSLALFFTADGKNPEDIKARLVFLAAIVAIAAISHYRSRLRFGAPPPPIPTPAKPRT